ncbi:MAG: iron donor protein CyaY [Myxococcales bacterium]|nr:iron donor protein CyaY [Myxococcales bacterium]
MPDERVYEERVGRAFRRLEDALEAVDPDIVEVTSTGDMVTLTLPRGVRCILNTQRAVAQLWLAARDSAWHFSWDDARSGWLDDKGRGVELFAQLERILLAEAGVTITL